MQAGLILMRRDLWVLALMPIGVVAVTIACGLPVAAQQATTAPNEPTTDVGQLFASTCFSEAQIDAILKYIRSLKPN